MQGTEVFSYVSELEDSGQYFLAAGGKITKRVIDSMHSMWTSEKHLGSHCWTQVAEGGPLIY